MCGKIFAAIIVFLFLIKNEILICTGYKYDGRSYGQYDVCGNGILIMSKYFDLRPSDQNYWNGSLSLGKLYPEGLDTVQISFTLDAPAKVFIEPDDGRIYTHDKAFHIRFFDNDGKFDNLYFRVEGESFGKFPNINWLRINNVKSCTDLRKWTLPVRGGEGDPELNNRANSTGGSVNVIPLSLADDILCGSRVINHQGYVTNGLSTNAGEWPWHAGIFYRKGPEVVKYKCGGTLISNDIVITAGHCLLENGAVLSPQRVIVKLGLHHRLISNRNTQEFQAYQLILHQHFQVAFLRNDIALVRLSTQVVYNEYVRPVCLWPKEDTDLRNVINQTGSVVGWGINEEEKLSDYLRQGSMPIVSKSTCLDSNREFFSQFVSDSNFCAGYRNGTSACNGDSGGGLFLQSTDTGAYLLRGIISLSVANEEKNICDTTEYVLFVDVARYLDWIEKMGHIQINDNSKTYLDQKRNQSSYIL